MHVFRLAPAQAIDNAGVHMIFVDKVSDNFQSLFLAGIRNNAQREIGAVERSDP